MTSNNSSNHENSFKVLAPINYGRTSRTPRSNISDRRRKHRIQRNMNKTISRLQIQQDTLNRIKNLPRQITSDPLIDFFYNGSTFEI
ncbi:hypothetical protein RCL_jg16257.t1 [Rhizophagus clarus]|uniref:Uncharacterized protein n=1 Tax=Rhizophagus clarus TaxID=94130 RepID=A0A8H3M4S4_9GLOM|nr:hypothetical protein RCL_jg16257.t1 [Rhizophagus clarus]